MRLSKQHAQSLLDFVFVMIVVAIGIMLLGPYVIRSVNAHLKSWEDGVDDSLKDPLRDADPSKLPKPQCACSPVLPHGCGVAGCLATERLWQRDCGPLGCEDPQRECRDDGGCCTAWVAAGPCRGDVFFPCPAGQMPKSRTCGGGVGFQLTCQPDPACTYKCQGTQPPNSTMCFGDDQGLRRDYNWTAVAQGGCTTVRKCEAECNTCYVVDTVRNTCQPVIPCCTNDGFCDLNPPGLEDCTCQDCINDPRCRPVFQCVARRSPSTGLNGENTAIPCQGGEVLTGGGTIEQSGQNSNYTYPSGNSWNCYGDGDNTACYAICCPQTPSLNCNIRSASNSAITTSIQCNSGEIATGGGTRENGTDNSDASYPIPGGWACRDKKGSGGIWKECYAICCTSTNPTFRCGTRLASGNSNVAVYCNSDETVTGGGVFDPREEDGSNFDYPINSGGNPAGNGESPTGWHCVGDGDNITCYVICCTR